MVKAYQFPPDFIWGAATASYQIEGAVEEDGRKPSVWDELCKQPGRIAGGASGKLACDHYHRYREDVALMKELGLKAYRFSIAWPRIFPDGHGKPNPKGLDFYDRLVDELLAKDIQPFATLFHWDLPLALEKEYGGWRSRDIVKHFTDYAVTVGEALGDRVKHFFTINEFLCFTDLGYKSGDFAPGIQCDAKTVNDVRHNAMLAHGSAVRALRAACPSDCKIGLAENVSTTVPVIETEANILAAKKAYLEKYSFYLRVLMEGRYQEQHLAGPDAPTIHEGDMEVISTPVDLVGINSYSPVRVKATDDELGWSSIPDIDGQEAGNSPWHTPGPEVIYWSTRWLKEIWDVKEVVISENGCYGLSDLADKGQRMDHERVRYLRQHLIAAQRTVSEGYPLKGYFAWSLMDNFEWLHGYEKRFGLLHIDYESQKRTPKLSAQFYKEVISQNRVV